jgi:DNA-directed RNA polymerase subunit M/transcription elongation factor TFIIS
MTTMTTCNQCGGAMIPCTDALVPALSCLRCGRLVPRTAARSVRASKVDEKALLRAARRQKMRRAAAS